MLLSAISVHQIPALISFGTGENIAGLVVMFVALVSVVGRIVGGFLGDYVNKRYILAVSYGFQLVGILIFANITATWHLILYVLFFGLGYGGTIPVAFALMADYFGRKSFGSILGLIVTMSTVFGVASPVFAGWVFDVTNSYRPAFLILSLTLMVSIPLILITRRPAKARQGIS